VAVLESHTSGVSALAVSPDGRFAISGSWDGTVRTPAEAPVAAATAFWTGTSLATSVFTK
jgi:WD40 repeat protein